MQTNKKLIYIAALSTLLASNAWAQSADEPQQFNLGIVNNSTHTLTYVDVNQGKGTTCSSFEGSKSIKPGAGFVVTESILGGNVLSCLYKFKTEGGDEVQLKIINPTSFYNATSSYGFFNAQLQPLSTTYTPEKYPILPRNLMHKSAVISLNPF